MYLTFTYILILSLSWFGYFPNDAHEEKAGGWRGKRKDPIFQIVVILKSYQILKITACRISFGPLWNHPFPRVSPHFYFWALFLFIPSLILISLVLPSVLYVVSKGVFPIHAVIQQDSPIHLYESWTYPINYSIIIFACLIYHTITHWNLYTALQGSTISTVYIYTWVRGKSYTSAEFIKLFFI